MRLFSIGDIFTIYRTNFEALALKYFKGSTDEERKEIISQLNNILTILTSLREDIDQLEGEITEFLKDTNKSLAQNESFFKILFEKRESKEHTPWEQPCTDIPPIDLGIKIDHQSDIEFINKTRGSE